MTRLASGQEVGGLDPIAPTTLFPFFYRLTLQLRGVIQHVDLSNLFNNLSNGQESVYSELRSGRDFAPEWQNRSVLTRKLLVQIWSSKPKASPLSASYEALFSLLNT